MKNGDIFLAELRARRILGGEFVRYEIPLEIWNDPGFDPGRWN